MEHNFQSLHNREFDKLTQKSQELNTWDFCCFIKNEMDIIEKKHPYYFQSYCSFLHNYLQGTKNKAKHSPCPTSWNDCVFFYSNFKIELNK